MSVRPQSEEVAANGDALVEQVLAPVKRQLLAYNARDLESFLENFAADCLIEDGTGRRIMKGHKAMRASYGKMFNSSPTLCCRVVSRVVVGNYVLDEERVTGRNGSEAEGHVVAVYRVEKGLIAHVRFLQ
jgi:hypothetical protein